MLFGEVEGVDRIRVDGQRRHILVHEGRGIGPCPPDRGAVQEQDRDRGTVAVQGIAGDTAGGRRPREGDPCGGHAGGREAGGGGGCPGRGGGKGMKDGAHRVPIGGGGEGARSMLAARGARGDVLLIGGTVRCLRPRRVRYAQAASGRHRAGRAAGHQGCEHDLARIDRWGRTSVDGRAHTARGDDLIERAGESDARILGDGSLQVRGRGDGYGNCHTAGRRLAVLAVVEGYVARVAHEGQRSGRPGPSAVHVVRYLNLLGGVELRKPPDQQIPPGDRAGERDGDRRDPRPGRECRSLDEGGVGRRLGERRAWKENSDGDDERGHAASSHPLSLAIHAPARSPVPLEPRLTPHGVPGGSTRAQTMPVRDLGPHERDDPSSPLLLHPSPRWERERALAASRMPHEPSCGRRGPDGRGPQLASSAYGTSISLARTYSPRLFACGSLRVDEATPSPSSPWTTKLRLQRFGSA